MDYTSIHAKALKRVQAKGAPVSFVKETPGAYDPIEDVTLPPTQEIIDGYAVEVPGDPEEYQTLELIGKGAITLFFVPTTFGEAPALHSTITWAGEVHTIQSVGPIRPAGDLIAARVIVT